MPHAISDSRSTKVSGSWKLYSLPPKTLGLEPSEGLGLFRNEWFSAPSAIPGLRKQREGNECTELNVRSGSESWFRQLLICHLRGVILNFSLLICKMAW